MSAGGHKEVFLSGRSGVVERLRRFFLGLGRGEHTNEVIYNVNLLGTVAAGLVRRVYVDTLDELIDDGRGQRVDLAALFTRAINCATFTAWACSLSNSVWRALAFSDNVRCSSS